MADPAETHWQRDIGNRQVTITAADRAAAEQQFVKDHGHPPAAADREAFRTLERDVAQNKYNTTIDAAVAAHPVVDAAVLKSLLYEESNMNPAERGRAYVGIAQLGAGEARAAGLRVDATVDERLDAEKSIGAAAVTLTEKDREMHGAYAKYGEPAGDERAKFTLASYNGGAGTVALAMKMAHETGLANAKQQGLTGAPAEAFAKSYATTFDNLLEPKNHPEQSPMYRAADHYLTKLGADPHEKYNEIGHYADDIVARARQDGRGVDAPTVAPPTVAPPTSTPAAPGPAHEPSQPHAGVLQSRGATLPGFHIAGEVRNGRLVETRAELEAKNHELSQAIAHAKAGTIDDVKFAGNGKESAAAIAAQNEVAQRAILSNLPEAMRAGYAAKMHLEPGPRIVGERVEGVSVESAAVLDAKNAQLQMGIAHAHHGFIDRAGFTAAPGESAAEVARQNDVLHGAIEHALPASMRASYRESVAAHTEHDANGPRTNGTHDAPAKHDAPATHAPDVHPAASAASASSLSAFEKSWRESGTVNPRTGHTTLPAVSATLDQKNHALDFRFTDAKGAQHTASMPVGESSVGRFDAAHILPGSYQLGNFSWSPTGSTHPHDRPYGWADIPVNTRDGADHIPVVLKNGHVGDGTTERLHGGGRSVDSQAPEQKLVPTLGCIRGENRDVEAVSRIIADGKKPIALTITRDSQSLGSVERSGDGGKTWANLPPGQPVVGRLHETNDPNTVEVVVRGGNPPQTVSFKTEQLGFTKDQIKEIAARDPNGQLGIGVDQYRQPVVNAKVDMDRVPAQQREPAGVGR